jgi:hypothetical protein
MPYKDRATYLRKQREFAAGRKARKQIANSLKNINPALTPTLSDARALPCKNPISPASNRVPRIEKTPVNPTRASTPKPDIFQFLKQANAARTAPASSTGKGIALGQDQNARARRAGFSVDDMGNAIRIVPTCAEQIVTTVYAPKTVK